MRHLLRASVLVLFALSHVLSAAGQEASATLYVRSDSDDTTVVTPRLRAKAPVGERTSAQLVYTVDVWTSASIDIRTAASKVVTEQRDEIDVALEHELADVTLTGDYRYSTEHDYESHGGTLAASIELANKSATLALSATAMFDQIGSVDDPAFSEQVRTLSGRVAFTQILDPDTLVQGIYELKHTDGYQASPYRRVGIGSADGTCAGDDIPCIFETSPELRIGHAIALRGRRALNDEISLGASYRLYVDDWALTSHTAEIQASAWLEAATLVSLHYRFYTQGAAEHYQQSYDEFEDGRGFYTRDKELSPLQSHRIGLELSRRWEISPAESLKTILALGPTFYRYDDYVLLPDGVTAFEATLTGVLEL